MESPVSTAASGRRMLRIASFTLVAAALLAAGFVVARDRMPRTREAADRRLRVVASFYPLYFFASKIGGDAAIVFNVTPAGAEPHEYELTPQDLVRIETSDLVLLNGLDFEPWGNRILADQQNQLPGVITVGEEAAILYKTGDGGRILNPHVWLSPPLARRMIEVIVEAFVSLDAARAEGFRANAAALQMRLTELDTAYRLGLRACRLRDIITSHAAFGYLAAEYGFNEIPIAGVSTDDEPSAREIADIAAFAKRNGITHIFFESLTSPELAKTIAEEAGAKTLALNPLEGLTDAEITEGKDYITEMTQNFHNLQIALHCLP